MTVCCAHCGQCNLVMAGKHGLCTCKNCGQTDYVIDEEDFEPNVVEVDVNIATKTDRESVLL